MKTTLVFLLTIGLFLTVQAKEFQVDFTVTSAEGCTFHIVGTVDMTITVPLKDSTVNGFEGSITVDGPSGCPHGTWNVNFGLMSGIPQNPVPTAGELAVLQEVLWNDSEMQDAVSEFE